MPGSLCDVLPSALSLLGTAGAEDRLGLSERVGDVRRVLVVLVDGMGYHLLPELAPCAPLLASVLHGTTGTIDQLACTFPSTTPTSLVSLGTGALPGEHGILGFTVNIPGTERVLTHIQWGHDPAPDVWAPIPTQFERAAQAGVPTAVVLPTVFGGSGLTTAAYRGARFCGVADGADPAQRMLAELARQPGLVFGYDASLDTAAHRYGVGSPEWLRAAARIDGQLTRLVTELPDDAALLVTADHGGLNAAPHSRVDVATDPALAAGLRVVAGEPRVRYLHTVEGATPDVAAAWAAVLGAHAEVLTRDESIARGLFGPVPAAHRARIGDVVVICRDEAVVLATDREPPEIARLIGFHGALTPAETAIPLIAVHG